MLSANNLLRPQDGGPVTVPTQDMVLGSYYLTMDRMGKAEKGAETIWCEDAGDTDLTAQSEVDADAFQAANAALAKDQKKATYRPLRIYASEEEALMAYNERHRAHCPILVRRTLTVDGVEHTAVVEATPAASSSTRTSPRTWFVDRTDPAHVCDYESPSPAARSSWARSSTAPSTSTASPWPLRFSMPSRPPVTSTPPRLPLPFPLRI
jgi:DNA-directed RNA polymerase subunit beta'